MILVDACTGYTKDYIIHVMKRWYIDIVDLLAMHRVVVLTQDKTDENNSLGIMCFLDSKGIGSQLSTP